MLITIILIIHNYNIFFVLKTSTPNFLLIFVHNVFYPCNMILVTLLRNNCVNLHRTSTPMELQLCMLALLTCVLSANLIFFVSMFVIHLGMSLVTLLRNICMNFHHASRSTGTAMVLQSCMLALTCACALGCHLRA